MQRFNIVLSLEVKEGWEHNLSISVSILHMAERLVVCSKVLTQLFF